MDLDVLIFGGGAAGLWLLAELTEKGRHHAELAPMLLDQIDALTSQIATLTIRIEQLLAAMPEAQPSPDDPTRAAGADPNLDPGNTPTRPIAVHAGTAAECARQALTAVVRLDAIPGLGP